MLANDLSKIVHIEFSVSEISNKIKDLLEENLGTIRVKGEISGLKFASSGHVYFNLKDNIAVLSCVCWKRLLPLLKLPLSEKSNGLEVAVIGKISSYEGQSKYQLIVEKIEPSGIGAIMQILNERKAKLEKEGLFDVARKKTIPTMPRLIGIITSIEGAVIRDIIHRISNRCPTNLLIWPTAVQGAGAADQITTGIREFNKLFGKDRPDVLIIARGGGSIEDLWPFNEEIVLRAVAASNIPIISAIGHANDYTLIDGVADISTPTPTAAAEMVSPERRVLIEKLDSLNLRLNKAFNELIKLYTQNLIHNNKILQRSKNYIENYQQKIDELSFRLSDCLPNLLKFKNTLLERFPILRLYPYKNIQYKKLQLEAYIKQLDNNIDKILNNCVTTLKLRSSLLQSLDYKNVLKRGFSLVKTEEGKFVTSVKQANNNDKFNVMFFDGNIKVKKL